MLTLDEMNICPPELQRREDIHPVLLEPLQRAMDIEPPQTPARESAALLETLLSAHTHTHTLNLARSQNMAQQNQVDGGTHFSRRLSCMLLGSSLTGLSSSPL